MNRRRLQYRPLLETLEDRQCPSGSTVVLPISAFLSQQGTSTVFTAPVPDQLAFNNSIYDPGTALATGTPASGVVSLISVDYTGQAAKYLQQHGINLHTTITGFVTETPFGTTGNMEVSLNLEVTNALTWVAAVPTADLDTPAVNTDPLELGYRAQDLVANPSLRPSLSDAHFQFTWQQEAGTPLPDLVRALIIGDSAPPGFAPERIDFQSWGTGTLDAAAIAGTPGQAAIVATSQVADLTNSNVPGTLADGFWQEPVDIVPLSSPAAHVGYLNGTLFVENTAHANDNVIVIPTPNGGAVLASNLGIGIYPAVTRVVVALDGGNNNVLIGNLPGATVDVATLDGNNNISVGNTDRLILSVGGGNNDLTTANSGPDAQFIFVAGNGNNNIDADNARTDEILVAGNGNNNLNSYGAADFIEMLGNGNNHLTDTDANDLIWIGGDGNNNIDNDGSGSLTELLAGNGHNHIRGSFVTPSGEGS